MKLQNITAKFILIVSILMAFILSIQFYFTNKTHEDILFELNRLKHSINTTTEKILVERFEDGIFELEKNDSINWILDSKKEFFDEYLSEIAEDEILVSEHENRFKAEYLKKWISKYKSPIKRIKEIDETKDPYSLLLSPTDREELYILEGDSNSNFNVIDIDISDSEASSKIFIRPGMKSTNSVKITTKTERDHVLSFEFPSFVSKSQVPRRLRYNYNTKAFSSVLDDIRNRNLLITLSLFGVSIIAIAAIAGRFLKPIKSLNQSFDKVVQGDLNVMVDSKSKDEIGELSASFNHMVKELRKNKDKEALIHRQERLASLGQLAASVAHEIKNPLNAINLTIEHLDDKFISEKEGQASAYIQTIQKEIRRLDKTVNNFLSYLRSEKLNKQTTDVNFLLDDIFNLYEREISVNKIKVNKRYAGNCFLNLDAERFNTALMNVIVNAIQAMPKGGNIDVETNCTSGIIKIQDSGTGIPMKTLENIFDLFYTTKSAGTGLGLPIAYKIVKEHGGELSIESEEGKGTLVSIKL